ncbi:succinate dehydrogenase/fumarate reductase cytochrome b subunit, b558 family [Xenococcus sp. PCC 7305]|uniref:succinate dehydrogenase cytochrome b subunit n=1 Tax=Xenococcus sp. PCC 7305 TaxID=102125 RepID=UPI0002AC76D7|nr:succinate dehydrogenase cytochrome b subunit [Xenococcus sp. PCC 7305]ELS02407.1 succinate dehydrogenase/fumarate reductase cytochrome b subunit, b558 family [Xenococcus sp. PCC 7305]
MTVTKDRSKLINLFYSSIGKKIITGLTGLGLTLFVCVHMLGNLVLLASPDSYNQLAHFIDSWGVLLSVVEFILLGAVIIHAGLGIAIRIKSERSRPVKYNMLKSAGNPSKQSLSSVSMIFTGLVLLIFLVFHLASFKFGTYYQTSVDGVVMRDLARLVIETFRNPFYTLGYLGVMLLLGLHLRHGFWSAWQSLGVLNSTWSPAVYAIALIFALLIAIGFIVLPLAIFLGFL